MCCFENMSLKFVDCRDVKHVDNKILPVTYFTLRTVWLLPGWVSAHCWRLHVN